MRTAIIIPFVHACPILAHSDLVRRTLHRLHKRRHAARPVAFPLDHTLAQLPVADRPPFALPVHCEKKPLQKAEVASPRLLGGFKLQFLARPHGRRVVLKPPNPVRAEGEGFQRSGREVEAWETAVAGGDGAEEVGGLGGGIEEGRG